MKRVLIILFLGAFVFGCTSLDFGKNHNNPIVGNWCSWTTKFEVAPNNTFALYGFNPQTGTYDILEVKGKWVEITNTSINVSGAGFLTSTVQYDNNTDAVVSGNMYLNNLYRC
jgi:hypothetical protein